VAARRRAGPDQGQADAQHTNPDAPQGCSPRLLDELTDPSGTLALPCLECGDESPLSFLILEARTHFRTTQGKKQKKAAMNRRTPNKAKPEFPMGQ
jgi:hypothetical protein